MEEELNQQGFERLQYKSSVQKRPWNTLLHEERGKIREIALSYPEWFSREVALLISDTCGFTLSESTPL